MTPSFLHVPNAANIQTDFTMHAVYGALKSVPMHAMGLAMLIMMRGGLQTLKLRGLAPIIS